MRLIRYIGFLAGQVAGLTVHTRRPGILILVAIGGLVGLFGIFVQALAPVVIYPFI